MTLQEAKENRKISLLLKKEGLSYELFDRIAKNRERAGMKHSLAPEKLHARVVNKVMNAYSLGTDSVEIFYGYMNRESIDSQIQKYAKVSNELKRKIYQYTKIAKGVQELNEIVDYFDIDFVKDDQDDVYEIVKVVYYFKKED